MSNVIPLRRMTHNCYEIVVLKASFPDSMMQAVKALRDNQVVLLNLGHLNQKQAQRILDFISGSAYAIAGQPSKVGRSVFLFTPYNIQLNLDRLIG